MADTTDEGVRAQIEADKNESFIFPEISLKIRKRKRTVKELKRW